VYSRLALTTIDIAFVSPAKVSKNFPSLISASDVYSSQYVADESPYSAPYDYSKSARETPVIQARVCVPSPWSFVSGLSWLWLFPSSFLLSVAQLGGDSTPGDSEMRLRRRAKKSVLTCCLGFYVLRISRCTSHCREVKANSRRSHHFKGKLRLYGSLAEPVTRGGDCGVGCRGL
jgi:hypothetical protein